MADMNLVALAGGVGGAKLADGLAQVLQPESLTVIVNTADDFTLMGLRISPDIDTVCYTIAGLANDETGWGRANETWNVFAHLKKLGMPDWFQLGDADLATHIARTTRLAQGMKLSQVTQEFCQKWGIRVNILPMSDDPVRTCISSDEGELEFQEYFVHRKCIPKVKAIQFVGSENSQPGPRVMEAIDAADAIIICPSNPWVSIDPILAVPGIQKAVSGKPTLAVSPIIGEQTVKGPAAKMFSEMGIKPSVLAVAEHYGKLIDSLAIDNSDMYMKDKVEALGIKVYISDILMHDRPDRGRLAGEIIENING